MKFERSFERNKVPEWSNDYINYKALRKLIRSVAEQAKRGDEAGLADFSHALDGCLESVDAFYNKKVEEARRIWLFFWDHYGDEEFLTDLGDEEKEEYRGGLLELRSQLRKARWYGELNRRAFTTIIKKMNEKVPAACLQLEDLMSIYWPRSFSTNYSLARDIEDVDERLSKLGEADTLNRTAYMYPVYTKLQSRASIDLPAELRNRINKAIEEDAGHELQASISKIEDHGDLLSYLVQSLLLRLLQRAVTKHTRNAVQVLLKHVDVLTDKKDLNQRNCMHRIIIAVGRAHVSEINRSVGGPLPRLEARNSITPAEVPAFEYNIYGLEDVDSSRLHDIDNKTAKSVDFLLSALNMKQRSALSARDLYGNWPLHYAAKYGFPNVCGIIMDHMLEWGQLDISKGIDELGWENLDNNSPVHLSVISGWKVTTEVLLKPFKHQREQSPKQNPWTKSNNLLSLAASMNFSNILDLLLEAGANVNWQDEEGQTALHIAARLGYLASAQVLLKRNSQRQPSLELTEKLSSWTPLHVACVHGNTSVVELLIKHGADISKSDDCGWTAKEHAVLRGHVSIVELLAKHAGKETANGSNLTMNGAAMGNIAGHERPINSDHEEEMISYACPDVRSSGRRTLNGKTMILVNLGSMNPRKNIKPVILANSSLAAIHTARLDVALSVVVSAIGAHGEPKIIDNPLLESANTSLIEFTTMDMSKVQLTFDIVPPHPRSSKNVIGRGVAVLSSLKPQIVARKMNLQGDLSVPIVAAETLEIIGTIHFNVTVITPLDLPQMTISKDHAYWKTLTTPLVVGHRGLGKNTTTQRSLQLGENTIQSFITAANLGASYVEFDVQLTKDKIPVIYHDFLVSETGVDAPVHTLTLEQFLSANETHKRSKLLKNVVCDDNGNAEERTRGARRANSLGGGGAIDNISNVQNDSMKHTRDMKIKGFKGNSRGIFVQAPFTTLEEMLCSLPKNIGFNIEMKYPTLLESEEEEMDTYATEMNTFVDTVLQKVYSLGQGRNFIFSSFNPDVCLTLSLKQPSIPILFLTDAGFSELGDIRCSSLQEAIRFAARWNLLGIVSSAQPFVECPRLVRVIREYGLVCLSYGTQNNNPVNVQKQVKEGMHAVIVDSVLAISKALAVATKNSEGEA